MKIKQPISQRLGIPTITTAMAAWINKQRADALLELNTDNRHMRESHINYIIRQIVNGNWVLTHQGIAISDKGRIIDGQQRLTAISRCGKAVKLFVFEGIPDAAFHNIDNGLLARTNADVTGLNTQITALIYAYNRFVLGATGSGGMKISPQEMTEIYNVRQVHFDTAQQYRAKERLISRAQIWAGIAYYSEQDNIKAVEFAKALNEPATDIKQAAVFRDWLFRCGMYTSQSDIVAKLAYCMDAHYTGKNIARIGSKKINEAFI